MSHLVTYDTENGPVQRQVPELHEAIALVEQLRNDVGVERARIFRLEEVTFEFRPYFRVAIADGPASGWGDPFAAAYPKVTALSLGDGAEVPAEEPTPAPTPAPVEAESTEPADTHGEPEPVEAAVETLVSTSGAAAGVDYDDEDDDLDDPVVWREAEGSPGVDAGVWAAVAGQAAHPGVRPTEDLSALPPPPLGARRNIFGR